MALSNGPNLELLVNGALGEEHYDELMAMWRGLDALIQGKVLDKDLGTPPGVPADGDCYIIPSGATGAWSGQTDKIARYSSVELTWEFYTPKAGWTMYVVDETLPYVYSGSAWAVSRQKQVFSIACSDEITALTSGTGKVTFRIPNAFQLTAVRASLSTAQSSGSIFTVDVNKNGTSVLSTKLTIDNTEKTTTTAATAAVISTSSFSDDDEVSIDIDQVGNGTAKGLKVTLIGYNLS